jgi:hypothetical protein
LQDPPKLTQIWIFGFKTNHLATLLTYSLICRVIIAIHVGMGDFRVELIFMLRFLNPTTELMMALLRVSVSTKPQETSIV